MLSRYTRRGLRRLMLFASVALLIAVMMTLVVLSYMQGAALAAPPRAPLNRSPDEAGITNWREVVFESSDGLHLKGWYIPPAADSNGAALVLVHGHGNNRTEFMPELPLFHQHGYGLLMFDLRNSGSSAGEKTSMGVHEVKDVMAAFAFLSAQPEVNPQRIGIYGHSMGAATAILAMPHLPQARVLVASAPYADPVQAFGEGVKRVTGLPPFPFGQMIALFTGLSADANLFEQRPIDVVAGIAPRPVMFIHGTLDYTIHPRHSQDLYAAAAEPKALYIIEGAGHVGLMRHNPSGFEANVMAFLDQYLKDEG